MQQLMTNKVENNMIELEPGDSLEVKFDPLVLPEEIVYAALEFLKRAQSQGQNLDPKSLYTLQMTFHSPNADDSLQFDVQSSRIPNPKHQG